MPNSILDDEISNENSKRKQQWHPFVILHYGWLIASILLAIYYCIQLGEELRWIDLFDTVFNKAWIYSFIPI